MSAFRDSHKRNKSISSSRRGSEISSSSKAKVTRDIYQPPPIKIVKMKVDNTYDYKLPPFYVEAFWQFMLESDEGMKKLNELHKNYPLRTKKAYNVVDYINSMDYVVRLMEIGLGLQFGGINKDFKEKLQSVNNARDDRDVKSEPNEEKMEESFSLSPNKVDQDKSIEFEDIGTDSDDVFANNPSNLMLAKVRVKKKSIVSNSMDIEDAWWWECKNCKWMDKSSLFRQKIGLDFSHDGNLLTFQDKPSRKKDLSKKDISVKSTTTQPTVISKRKDQKSRK